MLAGVLDLKKGSLAAESMQAGHFPEGHLPVFYCLLPCLETL